MTPRRNLITRVTRNVVLLLCGITASGVLAALVGAQELSAWHISSKVIVRSNDPSESVLKAPVLNAVFFADDSNGCAAGDGGALVCTNNRGKSWVVRQIDSSFNIQGGFFRNGRTGWMVGNARGAGLVLLTENGGVSWREQYKVTSFDLSGLHKVWFADEQHGWIVGEAQKNGVVQGIVLATEDGGAHWTTQYLGGARSSVLSAIKFLDAEHGWAVGQNVILRTDDGGQNWHEARYVKGTSFFDLDVINSGQVWVVGSDGTLLQSGDYGVSWQAREIPAKYQNTWVASVRFIGTTRGWVAGDDGAVFATRDGGRTWNLESIGKSEYLRALASTSDNVFAVGNSGVILRRTF